MTEDGGGPTPVGEWTVTVRLPKLSYPARMRFTAAGEVVLTTTGGRGTGTWTASGPGRFAFRIREDLEHEPGHWVDIAQDAEVDGDVFRSSGAASVYGPAGDLVRSATSSLAATRAAEDTAGASPARPRAHVVMEVPPVITCRLCGGSVYEFFDFGSQPLSDAFPLPHEAHDEFRYRLAVGACEECRMVQLVEEVPRERMFHADYPYRSSWSAVMREHFRSTAHRLLDTVPAGREPFIVEIGSNDGTMLRTIAERGVAHLGVEPSAGVARMAEERGVRVLVAFFEETLAKRIRDADGPADVVYAANTICHIPYLDSVFRGVAELLTPAGVFVFEDPYLGDVLARNSFDQVYDEHFYLFSATSVQATARRFGFDLVDVERLPVHGGEVRYTLARAGSRPVGPAVAELVAEERARGLTDRPGLDKWADAVRHNCRELVSLLRDLRARGKRVVGYGATAKSATVTNFAGIGPDLVPFVCDITPAKQGRLMPGSHIPVRPVEAFADPYPDYALLFAWNHAEEIIARERAFRDAGGRWILYVPDVHVV